MELVAFPVGVPVSKSGLRFFSDGYDASEYCYEMSTDVDQYTTLDVRSVHGIMKRALDDTSLMVERDGVVDISAMVVPDPLQLKRQNRNNQNFKTIKQKEDDMNEDNAKFLEKQMFYAGFGDIPKKDLEQQLKEGKEDFRLVLEKKYGTDEVKALLNFKKSEKVADMYFFNSYDLLLKKADKEETLQQNFRVAYGNTFTLKEGYNLLDGRSVNKDFIKVDREDKENNKEYNAWAYIDFKASDDYGNYVVEKTFHFDLEKKIEEYPIKNLEYPQNKRQLLDSLKKGNRPYVVLETSRGDQKMYIEAAPRYNSMNFYDERMEPIRLSVKKEGESQGQGQQAENSQATADEAESQSTGKSTSVSDDKKADAPAQAKGKKRGAAAEAGSNKTAPAKRAPAKRRSRGVA